MKQLLILAAVLLSRPVLAADWLQWGGPHGDFTVDAKGLAEAWAPDGPKQLWKRPLGPGYSSILYKGGQLFTMYLDGDHEVVVSLDAITGETNWEHRYARKLWPDMSRQFGLGPNSTPLIVGDRIISIGVAGQMRCLSLADGKLLWKHDLPGEYGRRKRVEEYGYSASPMPYNNSIIVQVGGNEHAVVAFHPDDGHVVWKSEPGGISYAQATITKLGGRDQFVYFEPEGVVGLNPSTGRVLWRKSIEFNNGNHLTPIVKCDENRIWVGSQFNTGGGRLLEITDGENGMEVSEKWFKRKLQASHWTSIRIGDFIYGSVGGNTTSFVAAFNWKTGDIAWRKRGFHKAQSLYADGKLLFLDETGELAIARVSPEDFEVLARAPVAESISWTLPTLVSTKLYLRDNRNILALDLANDANKQ